MTQNRLLHVALTTLVIVSVLVGAIAGPMLAPSSEAQPAPPGENSTTAPTNADTTADTTTNTPVPVVNNTNTNTNRANASATARSTGSSLDTSGNVTNGCALPPPGTNSFEELQKLLGNDSATGDQFGTSVAVDRATETIVVGAPSAANENGERAGAVYVFTCQGNQFVQTQKLLTSDGAANDSFGFSVAIEGDTIVVGAPNEDENGTDAGAAYVYERQGGQFAETQKLTASDAGDGLFGNEVAIDGETIIVGAVVDDNENGDAAGAAYVFD